MRQIAFHNLNWNMINSRVNYYKLAYSFLKSFLLLLVLFLMKWLTFIQDAFVRAISLFSLIITKNVISLPYNDKNCCKKREAYQYTENYQNCTRAWGFAVILLTAYIWMTAIAAAITILITRLTNAPWSDTTVGCGLTIMLSNIAAWTWTLLIKVAILASY